MRKKRGLPSNASAYPKVAETLRRQKVIFVETENKTLLKQVKDNFSIRCEKLDLVKKFWARFQ